MAKQPSNDWGTYYIIRGSENEDVDEDYYREYTECNDARRLDLLPCNGTAMMYSGAAEPSEN